MTQKRLSCNQHSPRYLAQKQAQHHFILLQTDTYNLYLKVICQSCFLSGILGVTHAHIKTQTHTQTHILQHIFGKYICDQ